MVSDLSRIVSPDIGLTMEEVKVLTRNSLEAYPEAVEHALKYLISSEGRHCNQSFRGSQPYQQIAFACSR